eukprot:3098714-Rhodomonas_salina.6
MRWTLYQELDSPFWTATPAHSGRATSAGHLCEFRKSATGSGGCTKSVNKGDSHSPQIDSQPSCDAAKARREGVGGDLLWEGGSSQFVTPQVSVLEMQYRQQYISRLVLTKQWGSGSPRH